MRLKLDYLKISTNCQSFGLIKKIKEPRKKTQVTKIRNEKWAIYTNLTDIGKIIMEHYEHCMPTN